MDKLHDHLQLDKPVYFENQLTKLNELYGKGASYMEIISQLKAMASGGSVFGIKESFYPEWQNEHFQLLLQKHQEYVVSLEKEILANDSKFINETVHQSLDSQLCQQVEKQPKILDSESVIMIMKNFDQLNLDKNQRAHFFQLLKNGGISALGRHGFYPQIAIINNMLNQYIDN